MTEPHVFKPGDVLDGRYLIGRLLGSGGVGEVFEAVEIGVGRRVAIKCARPRLQLDPGVRRRMENEARALRTLIHPNVVRVLEAGEQDGLVFLVMERLAGRTLREVFAAQRALPPLEVLRHCAEIADGLAAAHRVDVIHRDLKPENVFITDAGAVKVLDFGAARLTRQLGVTAGGAVVGTTAYMAPEQVKGQAELDGRADVYALFLILYEGLAGHHPFVHEGADVPTSAELSYRQLHAVVPPLTERAPHLPAYLWEITARGLAKDRERRYPSMEAAAEVLRAARRRCEDEAAAAPPPPANNGTDLMPRGMPLPAGHGSSGGLVGGITAPLPPGVAAAVALPSRGPSAPAASPATPSNARNRRGPGAPAPPSTSRRRLTDAPMWVAVMLGLVVAGAGWSIFSAVRRWTGPGETSAAERLPPEQQHPGVGR